MTVMRDFQTNVLLCPKSSPCILCAENLVPSLNPGCAIYQLYSHGPFTNLSETLFPDT